MWDPEQYHRYNDERSRPFFDLLAQVHLDAPSTIVDLGCGSGELTAVLSDRWPEARVHGVDSSPEMIAAARSYERADKLTFELGDLRTWKGAEPIDLLFSNAAYQWVGDHESLIPRLVDMLSPGGILAFQVPGNFTAPSHTILAELRFSERWNERLGGGAARAGSVKSPEWYAARLIEMGLEVNAWETTYMHILHGENAVLEWVKGTALRPVLAVLDGDERDEFLSEYAARLNEAYPPHEWGTLFPFRRLFVVGRARG